MRPAPVSATSGSDRNPLSASVQFRLKLIRGRKDRARGQLTLSNDQLRFSSLTRVQVLQEALVDRLLHMSAYDALIAVKVFS